MPWGYAAAAVGTLASSYLNNKGSKDAASAQARANDASIAEQQREYDQTRQDQQPWLTAGTNALSQISKLNAGDYSSFTNSPDYQFSYTQGLQGLDRSAAARGNLFSGGHDADVMNFASGLASQNYNNYYNKLASLAGLGQTTATNLGTAGQNMANKIGSYNTNTGNAYASSYQDQASNNSDTANALSNLFQSWYKDNSFGGV